MRVGVRLASGPRSDRETAATLRTGPPPPQLALTSRAHRPRDCTSSSTRRAIAAGAPRCVLLTKGVSKRRFLGNAPSYSPPPPRIAKSRRPPMATRAPVGLLQTRGLVPEGRCHAPHIADANPPFWHSTARPYGRPQPRAAGRGRMRFLVRAPDLAFAMWDVFPMARGSGGHSSTRSNAGELPHGPLRRLAALHVELTTWIGGPGLFLHFFHAMHAQTRTVFLRPQSTFLGTLR